jgi:hypothetical protein
LDPTRTYEERLAHHRAEAARLGARDRVTSIARIVAFVGIPLALMARWGWVAAGAAVAFVVLIVAHDRVLTRRRRAEAAARVCARGLARTGDGWAGEGRAGSEFVDEKHPFAADLDLFGRGSLYELLCIAATAAGRTTLARWLLHPEQASASEVRARQAAVEELRERVELREELAVLAEDVAGEIESAQLGAWAAAPPLLFSAAARAAAGVLAVLNVMTFAWFAREIYGVVLLGQALVPARLAPFGVMVVITAVFARTLHARVSWVIGTVERREPALALLALLLARLEREPFVSPRLVALHARLASAQQPASRSIERLRRLVALLEARRNQFFVPFAGLLLWSLQLAFAIERWRRDAGKHLGDWIEAVGEMEALLSLASFAFEHPAFLVPEIVDGDALFDAAGAAHPLIPAARRVPNDVRLGGELRLLIVSGSNMSGKSTMLRTIGINAVLALAGAPVCCTRLRVAPMAIGASISLHDSLAEGASRFYAEITRIRDVVHMPPPLLFLLDELLAGTNSHDRRIGAEAIVRGLVERGAIGLATTHDLALASIADDLAPRAANVHFEDHLDAGRVVFDYRMRPGVVTKSNALALMRAVGLIR